MSEVLIGRRAVIPLYALPIATAHGARLAADWLLPQSIVFSSRPSPLPGSLIGCYSREGGRSGRTPRTQLGLTRLREGTSAAIGCAARSSPASPAFLPPSLGGAADKGRRLGRACGAPLPLPFLSLSLFFLSFPLLLIFLSFFKLPFPSPSCPFPLHFLSFPFLYYPSSFLPVPFL